MRRSVIAIFPAILLFGVLLGIYVARHHHCLYDDAFIYLRYVRNVHAGCGVRWNCDDPPVEGFSSPLHFALLLVGSIFSSKLVFVSTVVGSLSLFAMGVIATIAAGETARQRTIATVVASLSVSALLALDHHVLLNAVIGMDSELAALFVLATWLALDRRAYRAAAAFAVIGMLARPEPMVFALLLPFFVPRVARRNVTLIIVAGALAITALRFALFHDVLPNTYWAKAGGTIGHVRIGAVYVVDAIRDFPIICLAPFALFDRQRRAATLFALAAVAVWFGAFLRTGGDTFVYSRLAFPVVPLLTVLAFRGVCAFFARRPKVHAYAHWLAAIVFAVVTARAVTSHSSPEQHGFPNVTRWTATGRYLEKTYPKKTVATIPIGAIGYTSKLHVLDLVGLTSAPIAKAGRTVPPHLLTREWIAHERHNLEYVEAQRPDVIVTTKFRETPWHSLDDTSAGFYADWLVLRAIKEGRMPYHVADAEVIPGLHWLIFVRD